CRNILQTLPDPFDHVFNGFYVVILDVDNACGNVHFFREDPQQLKFCKYPLSHLDVNFVYRQIKKIRKHGLNASIAYRPPLEIDKTDVRAESSLSNNRFCSSIRYFLKALCVFALGRTAHRWLVNRDFPAASFDKSDQRAL